jgi:peptidoglycan/xylan/chitin deacetylase (PgdA/CDA1 family)
LFKEYREPDTLGLIELLARDGIPLTVFMTGSLVGRHAGWALRLQQMGCEVGLHGYHHHSPNRMPADRFEADLRRCIRAFEGAGIAFSGYRAPNLAMTPGCYPILRRLGVAYSSSLLCSGASRDPMERCIAFMDVPLVLHDPGPGEIREALRPHLLPGAILCFHPYGLLGARHGRATRQLLVDSGLRTVTIAEQLQGAQGLAVSVDFGA